MSRRIAFIATIFKDPEMPTRPWTVTMRCVSAGVDQEVVLYEGARDAALEKLVAWVQATDERP